MHGRFLAVRGALATCTDDFFKLTAFFSEMGGADSAGAFFEPPPPLTEVVVQY